MLSINQLNFGFNDAENYKRKENKELFNKIFTRTEELEKLLQSDKYFLIGEKGVGKTAYAVYLSNNEYKESTGKIRYIRETEYLKFVQLKKDKHLQLTDYERIWRILIEVLISQQIQEKEPASNFVEKYVKFKPIQMALDEFYKSAFAPEFINAIHFIEDSKVSAELISKFIGLQGKIGSESSISTSFSEQKFQINLLYIQKCFEEAIRTFRPNKKHILFIDGIDIRPNSITYAEYLECIKGLANAVWAINNDLFSDLKGRGQIRVVLLIRPDIFNSLELQNKHNKLLDNSVILDWQTHYDEYRNSKIFEIADNILKFQQPEKLELGKTWDYYFPFNAQDVESKQTEFSAFIEMLRYSLYRPRDIVTMLTLLQKHFIQQKKTGPSFSLSDMQNPHFQKELAQYYLGEIKDQVSFYYSEKEFQIFLKFFNFLKGSGNFSYDQYIYAFNQYITYLNKNDISIPSFCQKHDDFLQFLYNLNILCYFEKTPHQRFTRWCFRERTYANISPFVETNKQYLIHQGMRKAFNIGQRIL